MDSLIAGLEHQRHSCQVLGSPFYAALLGPLIDDVRAGGRWAELLRQYDGDAKNGAIVLRVLGAAHRRALSGQAPELAAHYPSCGGDGDAAAAWPALDAVLSEDPDYFVEGLMVAPQTNEVGRAAALWGAVLTLSADLPLDLHEIGASAGLNLLADQFHYRADDGTSWGPTASPVRLNGAWQTVPGGPPSHQPRIVSRSGCDLHPIDIRDDAAALQLQSFVWPDMTERLERLRNAIELARQDPPTLVAASAPDYLAGLTPTAGRHTVIWHSVMWQYLSDSDRIAAEREFERLGAHARADAPVTRISLEPNPNERRGFAITITSWDGGPPRSRPAGWAAPHGIPAVFPDSASAS